MMIDVDVVLDYTTECFARKIFIQAFLSQNRNCMLLGS